MTSEGLLFTAVCDTNAASPSLGDAAIYAFHRRVNLVGYNGKASQAQMNWYVPHFLSVGQTTSDIQLIQLDDGGAGMVGWGDSMQIVGPGGNPIGGYFYWDKSMAPEEYQEQITNPCYWANEDMSPADKVFEPGEGFALDNGSELEFNVKIACPYSL